MPRFDRNEIRLFIVMTILCLAALVVLYLGHPSEYSCMPRCPFYLLTGMYCPGCGALRAIHYFLHGNISASVRHHPFLLPLLAFVFFLYVKRVCANVVSALVGNESACGIGVATGAGESS
jgi:hypothetical protein